MSLIAEQGKRKVKKCCSACDIGKRCIKAKAIQEEKVELEVSPNLDQGNQGQQKSESSSSEVVLEILAIPDLLLE